MADMDITRNIKAIEALKCALLGDIAALYEYMRRPVSPEARDALTADMMIHLYLLAKRLGLDFDGLDAAAAARLRRETLEEHCDADARALLFHLIEKR